MKNQYGLTVTLLPEHSENDQEEQKIATFLFNWYGNEFSSVEWSSVHMFLFTNKATRQKCYNQAKRLMVVGVERWKMVSED